MSLALWGTTARAGNIAVLVGVDYNPAGQQWAKDAQNINNALLAPNQQNAWQNNVTLVAGAADVNVNQMTVAQALQAAANKAQPGDAFFFYYSGHGSYFNDTTKQEKPPDNLKGSEEQTPNRSTLYLTNNQNNSQITGTGAITDWQLAQLLGQFKPGVKKFVFLDSCFAGGFWSGLPDAKDLESVPNTTFIAAADENSPASGDSKITENFINYLGMNKFDLSSLSANDLSTIFNMIKPTGMDKAGNIKDGPDPDNNPYGFPQPDAYNPLDPPISPDTEIPETPQFFTNVPAPASLPLLALGGLALVGACLRNRAKSGQPAS
jgi:hypothetical protein